MTMITRQIVGYDPKTERVAYEYFIPSDKWIDVMSLVKRNDEDPCQIYNYALDVSLANDIVGLIGGRRVEPNLRYFLECEAAD